MAFCIRIFCTFFLCAVLVSNKYSARADYVLRIQLLSYASIPHIKYNGFCCGAQNQTSGTCIEDCSNRFRFCLRPTGFSSESDACPESQVLTTGPISDDSMEFEGGIDLDDGVPNPLLFTGLRWLGEMDFHVRVDHGEEGVAGVQQTVSTQDSLVARFSVPIAANPVDSTSTNLESLHKDIRNRGPHIRIGFELRCSENFYGEDCSRNCVSRDDIGGHFVCDMQGNKRCMSGYQNLLTNCTECALSPECSPVGGYCNLTDNCICRDGFSGEDCSIPDPCSESLCQNGATCTSLSPLVGRMMLMNFNCTCPRGYVGTFCEISVAVECDTNPCENGGVCRELEGSVAGFECICSSGFKGNRCDERTTAFLGPFIGAAIAIALLFLIIVILMVLLLYAIWQYKHRKRNKRKSDSGSKFYGTSLSTLTNSSPTTNAKTYEDLMDADPASLAEAAEIASAAGRGAGDGEEYSRVRSETFDNPIYDRPTLPRRKKHGSTTSMRTGEADSKLGSVSSVRSISVSSSQNYSPPSARALKNSPSQHDYEDIKTSFDDLPKLSSSFRGGSAQLMSHSGEVDKLTVINESYDSLPCSGSNSLSYFQHSRPQASSVPNCTVADGHRIAGRPIITEVTISEAFSKRKKLPSHHPEYPADVIDANLGANSCEMVEVVIETSQQ